MPGGKGVAGDRSATIVTRATHYACGTPPQVLSLAPSITLRCLRFATDAILAVVFLFCALLLAIRFIVFPNIDDYHDAIAEKLGQQLGQPVAIASIAGSWDGWNPKLSITGFAIRDGANPAAPPVLLLPRVDLVVAWTSVLVLDLRLRELAIDSPELSVRRDTSGRLHVAGVEIDPDTQGNDTRFTDWLLRQREINVRNALLTWKDDLRDAPPLVLDHVMFTLQQSFGRHRFGLVGNPPPALASPLDFRGEITAMSSKDWRAARGRFYVRLDYADVAQWRAWVPVLRPVESGKGAVRVWFDFADGKPTNVVADLELTEVRGRVAANLPQGDLSHLGGRITWKSEPGRRELATQGLSFRTQSGQELPPVAVTMAFMLDENADGAITGGDVAFDKLDVGPLAVLAEHLPFPEKWRHDLVAFALRGSVTGGKFSWQGPPDAPTKYSGGGAFSRLAIAANEALPGASGVSGSFTFDETHGDLKLDSRDMRVSLPRVFADTLMFDTASGAVRWSRGDDGLRIGIDNVRFVTPHTSGSASGSWRSRPQGPGIIDLKAQLGRADAKHLYAYLPLTLDRHIRDWLRAGVKQGVATDVKIALAGDLADFPFADAKRGQFLVTFHAADATLDYVEGWPEITGIDADVKFEGTGLVIDAKSGPHLRRAGRAGQGGHSASRRPVSAAHDRRRGHGHHLRFPALCRPESGRRLDRTFHRRDAGYRQRQAHSQCAIAARQGIGGEGRRRLPVHRQPAARAGRTHAGASQRSSRVHRSHDAIARSLRRGLWWYDEDRGVQCRRPRADCRQRHGQSRAAEG